MTANPYRDARMARPMTQSALAKASGVSERTIRDLEKGRPVSTETVLAIRAVLGITEGGTPTAGVDPYERTERSPETVRRLHLVVADFLILASILPCLANLAIAATSTARPSIETAMNIAVAVLAFSPAMLAALFRSGNPSMTIRHGRMLQTHRGALGIMLTQPTITENASSPLSLAMGLSLAVWIVFLTIPSTVILLDAVLPPAVRRLGSYAGTASKEIAGTASMVARGARAILRDVWTSGRGHGS